MRSFVWALVQCDWCSYKRKKRPREDRGLKGEDGCVKTEADVGLVLPQAQEHLGYQKSKEAWKGPLLETSEGARTYPCLILVSVLQKCERTNICFKPPSL